MLALHQTEHQEFAAFIVFEDSGGPAREVRQHINAQFAWCLTVSRSRVDNAVDKRLPSSPDDELRILPRGGRRLARNQLSTCLHATRTPDQRCSVAVLIMATRDSRATSASSCRLGLVRRTRSTFLRRRLEVQ
jgi:hypothetical protein